MRKTAASMWIWDILGGCRTMNCSTTSRTGRPASGCWWISPQNTAPTPRVGGEGHGTPASAEEIDRRQARLVQTLETRDDPDGSVFARVRERLAELEHERRAKLDELGGLEQSRPADQCQEPRLLDDLPV